MCADVARLQPDGRHAARLASASGMYAGAWLATMPLARHTSAAPYTFRTALCMRLGAPLDELRAAGGSEGHPCPNCGEPLDLYGFHPGTCKRGNVGYAWTQRSEALESAIASAANAMHVYALRVGNANWFGVAGWDPAAGGGRGRYRKADVVCPGFFGGGQRHLYLDAAIVDGAGAVASRVGAASSGMTAATREAAKVRKYGPICERIGAEFRAAVIERLGCCGDGLCSVIKLFSGDGDRDEMEDDYSFSAPSRTTYVAQRIVFAAVMADAEMVCEVVQQAAFGIPRRVVSRG